MGRNLSIEVEFPVFADKRSDNVDLLPAMSVLPENFRARGVLLRLTGSPGI